MFHLMNTYNSSIEVTALQVNFSFSCTCIPQGGDFFISNSNYSYYWKKSKHFLSVYNVPQVLYMYYLFSLHNNPMKYVLLLSTCTAEETWSLRFLSN